MVPFVYSIANFPTLRCLEQIRVDVCYHDAPVKIVAVGGGLALRSAGLYPSRGRGYRGDADSAGNDCCRAGRSGGNLCLTIAIARHAGPCYLRLGKAKEPIVHREPTEIELGKAVQTRTGSDLTLISTGTMLAETMQAAERLSEQGLKCVC